MARIEDADAERLESYIKRVFAAQALTGTVLLNRV